MEAGGGPERDDYGLPPVDIEIPDDARELDPDVHAYRRELRALRRQQRANRWRRPLGRDGMALPLLAGCLMLALITSTLLVLFAAGETGMPQLSRPAAARRAPATARTPAARQAGQPLPVAMIIIDSGTVQLQNLVRRAPALLALVPQDCACAPALRQLATQARAAKVPMYMIGTPGAMTQLTQLAAAAGQSRDSVGDDVLDVLPTAYRESGLTAVVVHTGGSVASVQRGLQRPAAMTGLQAALRQVSPAAAGH